MSHRAVRRPGAADVDATRHVVRTHLAPTPLVASPLLGRGVHLKLETVQPTGSFKVRGALAATAAALESDPSKPLVTASAGNHGLGMAFAAERLGATVTIVVPQTASTAKLAMLDRFAGVTLARRGDTYDDAEAAALRLAGEVGALYVSPYNDPAVIAGQATVFDEIDAARRESAGGDVAETLVVVAPAGGGGLLAGIGLAARGATGCAAAGAVTVIGAGAARSPALRVAIEHHRAHPDAPGPAVGIGPTLADGLAGNVEPGSVTVPMCAGSIERIVDIDEHELTTAVRFAATEHGLVIEGSAAAGVAALLCGHVEPGPACVVVVTGRNIAPASLARVLSA